MSKYKKLARVSFIKIKDHYRRSNQGPVEVGARPRSILDQTIGSRNTESNNRHLIRTLHNDLNTLSHLFNMNTVMIIVISSSTYRYFRIQSVKKIIRCCSS